MTARIINTALGAFTAVVSGGAVVGLGSGARLITQPEQPEDVPLLDELERQIAAYAGGKRQRFDMPVQLCGTAFQNAVWTALVSIPYGETRTYGQIAAAIGHPNAARAVGNACGKNPVLLLVPCHRVTAENGIGGFSAPMRLKRALLRLEQQG